MNLNSQLAKRKTKRGMTMYAGIFIGDYAKNMAFNEHSSGTNMRQTE